MFTNNRRYIAENDTRDDYICLDLRLSSPTQTWERAIQIMRGRIIGRFLDPMAVLIQDDVNKNGFAAMALCCLLIETLLQFHDGLSETPRGQNQDCYADFLSNQLGHIFSNRHMARRFYKDIRCGILHSAQTKNGSCLTFGTNYTVRIQGNRIMMVNVERMCREMGQYFDKYCDRLRESTNKELRTNFIKKMNDITKKWDGSNVVDNLWFAICEKENMEIERLNLRPFWFRVMSDRDAIKINNSVCITKEEIEDALYYWPNERAIQMLNKGHYILPILNLCRGVADDIIQRQIA